MGRGIRQGVPLGNPLQAVNPPNTVTWRGRPHPSKEPPQALAIESPASTVAAAATARPPGLNQAQRQPTAPATAAELPFVRTIRVVGHRSGPDRAVLHSVAELRSVGTAGAAVWKISLRRRKRTMTTDRKAYSPDSTTASLSVGIETSFPIQKFRHITILIQIQAIASGPGILTSRTGTIMTKIPGTPSGPQNRSHRHTHHPMQAAAARSVAIPLSRALQDIIMANLPRPTTDNNAGDDMACMIPSDIACHFGEFYPKNLLQDKEKAVELEIGACSNTFNYRLQPLTRL